jgi:acetoin utilization deacetylase AcuC-like enzyme
MLGESYHPRKSGLQGFRVIEGLRSRERAGYCTFNGLEIAAKDSPAAFVLAGGYVGDGLTRDELVALHVTAFTKAHEIWARKQAEKQRRSNRWRLGEDEVMR